MQFGLAIPQTCPDVPDDILNPANTWVMKLYMTKKAVELTQNFKLVHNLGIPNNGRAEKTLRCIQKRRAETHMDKLFF
jgi:ATP-dependent phosphoenolpyruvate carboxykinase